MKAKARQALGILEIGVLLEELIKAVPSSYRMLNDPPKGIFLKQNQTFLSGCWWLWNVLGITLLILLKGSFDSEQSDSRYPSKTLFLPLQTPDSRYPALPSQKLLAIQQRPNQNTPTRA